MPWKSPIGWLGVLFRNIVPNSGLVAAVGLMPRRACVMPPGGLLVMASVTLTESEDAMMAPTSAASVSMVGAAGGLVLNSIELLALACTHASALRTMMLGSGLGVITGVTRARTLLTATPAWQMPS